MKKKSFISWKMARTRQTARSKKILDNNSDSDNAIMPRKRSDKKDNTKDNTEIIDYDSENSSDSESDYGKKSTFNDFITNKKLFKNRNPIYSTLLSNFLDNKFGDKINFIDIFSAKYFDTFKEFFDEILKKEGISWKSFRKNFNFPLNTSDPEKIVLKFISKLRSDRNELSSEEDNEQEIFDIRIYFNIRFYGDFFSEIFENINENLFINDLTNDFNEFLAKFINRENIKYECDGKSEIDVKYSKVHKKYYGFYTYDKNNFRRICVQIKTKDENYNKINFSNYFYENNVRKNINVVANIYSIKTSETNYETEEIINLFLE